MHQLRVTAGPGAGKTLPLQAGKSYVIGRDETVDLPFADPTMSRQHADLVPQGDGWLLKNRSQHGVLVGGQVVTGEVALAPGVQVTIGGTTLAFEALDVTAAKQAGFSAGLQAGIAARDATSRAPGAAGPSAPGWGLPCGCACVSYLGCAALTFAITMGALAAAWEMRIQRELRADDSAIVSGIAAPIAGLIFGLLVLLLMRMREVKKAKASGYVG